MSYSIEIQLTRIEVYFQITQCMKNKASYFRFAAVKYIEVDAEGAYYISLLYLLFYSFVSMSNLKELTEQATTDRQDTKKLAHLKTHTFYIFYKNSHQLDSFHSLQKLSFKLKDDKSVSSSDIKGDLKKQAQLLFYNLESEKQKNQGLLDLKMAKLEGKSKIVAYCSEQIILQLVSRAIHVNIDLNNIPIILIHPHPISDFSIFSGWNNAQMSSFTQMSLGNLENLSKKWIQSAQEKVDVWRAKIRWKSGGRLQKLVGQNFEAIQEGSEYQQLFLSHFSLGYHVKLSKNYLQKVKSPQKTTTNGLIYGWERFKNFCCLGSSNMRASTGVVNINYVDDKGHQFEILKHLRQYDGSQESEVQASKVVKSDKDIFTLLITNIDRFHGKKIQVTGGKPGDCKLEIVLFQGANSCRKIGSVGGAVVLKLESEMVQLQIGESVYRCWGGQEIRIDHALRVKIAINHEVLEC